MNPKTTVTKAKTIHREWHLIDAQDQILGRLSTRLARLLMGKDKTYFVPHLDCGDWVVVTNAAGIRLTGNKTQQKFYFRHSTYPGGAKITPFLAQMQKNPAEVIKTAVNGMLPKNKLRSRRLSRLRVFAAEKHSYQNKFL